MRFLATGAMVHESIAEAFRERWGPRIIPMYHTTEAGAISCDRKGLAPETVGKALEGVELRLDDARPDGTQPIWVRSPAVAQRSVGSLVVAPAGGKGRAPVGSLDAEGTKSRAALFGLHSERGSEQRASTTPAATLGK